MDVLGVDLGAAAPIVILVLIVFIVLGIVALVAFIGWRSLGRHRLELALSSSEVQLLEGDPKAALDQAAHALRLEPGNLDATVLYASALLRMGQSETAYTFLRAQDRVVGDDTGVVHLLASLALLDQGKDAEAGQELRLAIAENPNVREEIERTELGQLLLDPESKPKEGADPAPTLGYS